MPAPSLNLPRQHKRVRWIWGLPKVRDTVLGVLIIRTIVYLGIYWGPLIQGNYNLGWGSDGVRPSGLVKPMQACGVYLWGFGGYIIKITLKRQQILSPPGFEFLSSPLVPPSTCDYGVGEGPG